MVGGFVAGGSEDAGMSFVVKLVNSAARAANAVLEVMYPREDPAHVWDDSISPAARLAGSYSGTPAADPHLGGVADPEAGVVPPAPASGSLNLPWEVIDLGRPGVYRWGIADRWGVTVGQFKTEDQAYAVVEAVSASTLAGGPQLW